MHFASYDTSLYKDNLLLACHVTSSHLDIISVMLDVDTQSMLHFQNIVILYPVYLTGN